MFYLDTILRYKGVLVLAKLVKKNYLLAPGPTPVPVDLLLEGARDTIHHRTPQFKKIMDEAIEGTKYVFQTKRIFFFSLLREPALWKWQWQTSFLLVKRS